jgi:hypothetical protein
MFSSVGVGRGLREAVPGDLRRADREVVAVRATVAAER